MGEVTIATYRDVDVGLRKDVSSLWNFCVPLGQFADLHSCSICIVYSSNPISSLGRLRALELVYGFPHLTHQVLTFTMGPDVSPAIQGIISTLYSPSNVRNAQAHIHISRSSVRPSSGQGIHTNIEEMAVQVIREEHDGHLVPKSSPTSMDMFVFHLAI